MVRLHGQRELAGLAICLLLLAGCQKQTPGPGAQRSSEEVSSTSSTLAEVTLEVTGMS